MSQKRKFSGMSRPAKRMRRGRMTGRRRRNLRRYYRRRRGGRSYTKLNRQPIPDRMLTKLRYVDFLTLVPPNDGSYATMSWQTSIFDPQANVGGHKPLWTDTFKNIYSFYRVHGIKYNIRIASSYSYPVEGVITTKPGSSAYGASLITEAERHNCHHTFLLSGNDATSRTMKGYVAPHKVLGISKTAYKELDDTKAVFTANPGRTAELSLLYNSPMGTGTSNIQAWVKLTYYVEFWQRQMPGGS